MYLFEIQRRETGECMKAEHKNHKNILIAVVLTLLMIAIINNVSTLEAVKQLINGKRGWF